MESPLLNKSLEFATKIVLFYEEYSKSKRDTTIAKQLLRSATSVGANINEAIYGNSKPDFIAKLHVSLFIACFVFYSKKTIVSKRSQMSNILPENT